MGWPKIESELQDLFIIILALGFCFSLRWEGVETISAWFFNFLIVTFLVAISIGIHEFVHAYVAEKHLARAKTKVWSYGILAAVLTAIFTNGLIVFAAPFAVAIYPDRFIKFGKHSSSGHLGPQDRALIALSGPLANLALAVIAKFMFPVFGNLALTFMKINVFLAIFNLFPFFTILPNLFMRKAAVEFGKKQSEIGYTEGEYLFFGNRLLWVFCFSLTLILGISLFYFDIIYSLFLALAFSILLSVFWMKQFEIK